MGRTIGLSLVALLLIGNDLETGNRLYRDGRFAEAAEAYRAAIEEEGASPELYYNLGTTLLRLGDLPAAEEAFDAALSAVEPDLRQRTLYNLGSRYLAGGRAADDPRVRGTLLDQAVAAYQQALRLSPEDQQAKWNYELALREREENEQEQQDQEEENQGGGGGEAEQQNQGGGGGGDDRSNASPGGAGDRDAPAEPGGGGMSREQAEQLLSAVEQDERELYRESLRKGRDPRSARRNW